MSVNRWCVCDNECMSMVGGRVAMMVGVSVMVGVCQWLVTVCQRLDGSQLSAHSLRSFAHRWLLHFSGGGRVSVVVAQRFPSLWNPVWWALLLYMQLWTPQLVEGLTRNVYKM